MRFFRLSILSAGLLLAFSSVAAADGDWQTVSLDNNPDFTIDVPAVVGDDYRMDAKNLAKGNLAYFSVVTEHSGGMFCMLSRSPYDDKMNAQQAAEKLKTSTRDVLCSAGDNMTNVTVGESESLTSNGFPAGRCSASYTSTSASEKDKGWVESVMMVAAPDALYQLNCELHTDSQDEATAQWVLRWADDIHHIQQSLHLPAGTR
jgi:hypothetical protein